MSNNKEQFDSIVGNSYGTAVPKIEELDPPSLAELAKERILIQGLPELEAFPAVVVFSSPSTFKDIDGEYVALTTYLPRLNRYYEQEGVRILRYQNLHSKGEVIDYMDITYDSTSDQYSVAKWIDGRSAAPFGGIGWEEFLHNLAWQELLPGEGFKLEKVEGE